MSSSLTNEREPSEVSCRFRFGGEERFTDHHTRLPTLRERETDHPFDPIGAQWRNGRRDAAALLLIMGSSYLIVVQRKRHRLTGPTREPERAKVCRYLFEREILA